jgi:hypothetical protein
LDSVNRKVLLKTFNNVLKGIKVDLDTNTLEFEKNNRFSLIAEDNYKIALLLQCKRFYDMIHSDEKYIIRQLKPAWKKILPYTEVEVNGKSEIQWLAQLESHEARYYSYILT